MFAKIENVNPTFPKAKRGALAYDRAQVDTFVETARYAYDNYDHLHPAMTAADVRRVAFDIVKKGYAASAVDEGLERLENAFAEMEREYLVITFGWEELSQQSRARIDAVSAQLSGLPKSRFARVPKTAIGYRVSDVDTFINDVLAGLNGESTLRASWVRRAIFRPQKGGYNETDVDLVLDDLIAALVASGAA